MLVSLEGLDGCGKTTQVKELSKYYSEIGVENIVVRFPGQTEFGAKIRQQVLFNKNLSKESVLFLFLADFSITLDTVIIPALENGVRVITDRFIPSCLAYQTLEGFDEEFIKTQIKVFQDKLKNYLQVPIYLDIDPKTSIERKESRGISDDRYEGKGLDFLKDLHRKYLELKLSGEFIYSIDGKQDLKDVTEQLKELINGYKR